jgi:uncharacterized protein with von Willebrand factor type A (vWA) domain
MSRYRYGAWHGGDPLAAPYDVRAAVDALGRDVLEGRSLSESLRDLLRNGMHDPATGERRRGLDDLRDRIRRRRDELRRSGDLSGTLQQVRELLDRALEADRRRLDYDGDDDAQLPQARLDALPEQTAPAVRELADYDWRSPQARADYQQIREMLRSEVLDQQFAGLKEALRGDPEANQAIKDMLADLNSLLAAHARGEDTTDQFAQFMDRHGDFFPEQPQDVDELIDLLAQRAAAAERFMRSLSPDQRRELAQLVADALGDADLAAEMAALRDHLRDLRPGMDWTSRERFSGDEPLGYGEATQAIGELADLDELADQLGQDYPGATLDDVDVETVERQLGPGAAADVRSLRQLERELRSQGWLQRSEDGLALTPKALRRLGQSALRHVFAQLQARGHGDHDEHSAGTAGEPTGSWRAWRFGDEQPLDAVRTVSNAVLRTATHPALRDHARPSTSRRSAVRLDVEDFAVVETEHRAAAAVALCVDLSWSMYAEGRWAAMKQTALALQHLIATRYRQDSLQVIGFDRWARRLSAMDLVAVEPAWIQGTNLAHALALAGQHVRRHPQDEPVVLVVTDGEPTAHLEDDGEPYFAWPTTAETLRRTLVEVDALTRSGIPINTFMLGDEPGMRRFVDALARRNGGRVLAPSPDRLGEFVVADYLRARRPRNRAS